MAVNELICPHCSHRNRVPEGASTFCCWNCKRPFAIATSSGKQRSSPAVIAVIGIAGISLIGSILANHKTTVSPPIAARQVPAPSAEPRKPTGSVAFQPWPNAPLAARPNLPQYIEPVPLALAPSVESLVPVKAVTGFLKRPTGSPVSPLTIKTASGANYFVRLVDVSSRKREVEIFIVGGEIFSGKIPLGRYRMRYASGPTWFGEKKRFGPQTSYAEASETFEFRRDKHHIYGYTIELIMQFAGNLATHAISEKDFDK